MSGLEALLLGLIQGLTEFLPVSSSGHLEIGAALLKTESEDHLLFTVVVHLATALATILVFKEDIKTIVIEIFKFQWNESTKFATLIFISMIPVFIVGIFFKDTIASLFSGKITLVGAMLLFTGLFLFFAHYKKSKGANMGPLSAFVVGLAQAFAVLPGISRSGATISTALLLGVDREKAARFSFLMVLPPIIGASLLQLKDYVENPDLHQMEALPLIIGFLAAFVSGFIACKWMLQIVKKGKLTYFGGYCLVLGLIVILTTI